VPFLLRGVMYDPKDIERFNDRDLHMIAGRPGDPLVAIDDRALMVTWWQLSFLSAMDQPEKVVSETGNGDSVHIEPPDKGRSGGAGILAGPTFPPFSVGDRLELGEGQIFHDLTEESSGFLGLGSDWNDRISSVQMVATTKAVLWEHVNEGGSSLTVTQSMASLPGWNDRASSCWTQ
jgi:hypothetical protein